MLTLLSLSALIRTLTALNKNLLLATLTILRLILTSTFPRSPPYSITLLSSDFLGYPLIILSFWLLMSVIASSPNLVLYLLYPLLILLTVTIFFSSTNLVLFYIAFEAVLIPIFLIIISFGAQPERKERAIYIIVYTILASLPLLISLIIIFKRLHSLRHPIISLLKNDVTPIVSVIIILAFLVKIPIYSLHLWLPKAHVEAPTEGSIILAGILLKLGSYGLIRRILMVTLTIKLIISIMAISLVGRVLSSLHCISQPDLKKVIAYSSVAHISFITCRLMTNSHLAIIASIVRRVRHGLCSAALFYLVHLFYTRTKTRSIALIKGRLHPNPKLAIWVFIIIIANIATPPFISFITEVLIGVTLIKHSLLILPPLIIRYFFPVAYSMLIFSTLNHGQPPIGSSVYPITNKEILIIFILRTPLILLLGKLEILIS